MRGLKWVEKIIAIKSNRAVGTGYEGVHWNVFQSLASRDRAAEAGITIPVASRPPFCLLACIIIFSI